MRNMTMSRTWRLAGLLAVLLALGGVAIAARHATAADAAPTTQARAGLNAAFAGLPSPDARGKARQALTHYGNTGAPATVKVGLVERTALANWLNARQGLAKRDARKMIWPVFYALGAISALIAMTLLIWFLPRLPESPPSPDRTPTTSALNTNSRLLRLAETCSGQAQSG